MSNLLPVGDELALLNDQRGGIRAINAADGTARWRVGGVPSSAILWKPHSMLPWVPSLRTRTGSSIACI